MTKGAVTASQRKPATKVVIFQCPCGTRPTSRSPRRPLPQNARPLPAETTRPAQLQPPAPANPQNMVWPSLIPPSAMHQESLIQPRLRILYDSTNLKSALGAVGNHLLKVLPDF